MSVTAPQGFRAAGVACGIKNSGALDLALVASARPCTAAGVFTTNQIKAAPVRYDQVLLARRRAGFRAVVINSGNANACTGPKGLSDVYSVTELAGFLLGFPPDTILVMSTGVIGVPLPVDKIRAGLMRAVPALSEEGGEAAARAIMTTDTRPKMGVRRLTLHGVPVTIGGMAKGAGMIHPHMATMLALITTDAEIDPDHLEALLRAAVDASFHRISVDGDQSTNDTVMILANGASGARVDERSMPLFQEALTDLCIELAKAIVQDGEGATKLVEIRVRGARTPEEARWIARHIARSPLVKTAFYGEDPNWGRILAAAGSAGVTFDSDAVSLWIQRENEPPLLLFDRGSPAFYFEEEARRIFQAPSFRVLIDLGLGEGENWVWTCDLSHDYVSINGSYRT
ncbi:bifunctional glutamate N-acetyltransferase/amino-acid acetyltransferase ArgJ [Thermoflexus sp.]|uniref:bifunctional glutamate N-acetyltransferase/amino-acid acetyltransferase ArgJ n=1 Tax=Thermoflexus sp. TaxID=1969742 RepID=UPI0025F7758E|nr:bifunctional glutamate N-acetyltransferase/amino-acid acetyltransferase ArgJ [Thermoflexus sp.]MCS6963262.1 bifunctional glutamate N-acetyltransferase/amino-acid acetyltransferase ArgJ [Thermoflexus sp.]MCS7351517.1 bifunctional glutamate N-acetyltransferase/amino-acid acetyltransferase ArgJ [Thermoflexus sp.]MCX7690623.1 bifunctional glutamate N-acetyltransferase/amino-acid acetyltransferase ArgJ [Thermoflexus sp.]MDW8180975.1 bifunctional glutamate N-acetyltransferase/amino-acid acetyltran